MGAGGSVAPGRYSVYEAESYCRQHEMEPNSLSLFLSTDGGSVEIPENWRTKLPVTTDAPPTNVEEDGDNEEDESVASLRTTIGSHIMILYCSPSDDDVSRELVTELRRNLCERGCDVWLDIHGSKRLPHDESTDWQAKARTAVDFASHVIVIVAKKFTIKHEFKVLHEYTRSLLSSKELHRVFYVRLDDSPETVLGKQEFPAQSNTHFFDVGSSNPDGIAREIVNVIRSDDTMLVRGRRRSSSAGLTLSAEQMLERKAALLEEQLRNTRTEHDHLRGKYESMKRNLIKTLWRDCRRLDECVSIPELDSSLTDNLSAGSKVGEYTIVGVVSEGLITSVLSVCDDSNRENCSMKVVTKSSVRSMKLLQFIANEILVLRSKEMVDSKHIVHIQDTFQSTEHLYIVYAPSNARQDLWDFIHEQKDRVLDSSYVAALAKRLLQAVEFIHSRGVCHRDIKLENIIVECDGDGVVKDLKLCNFGHATRFRDSLQYVAFLTHNWGNKTTDGKSENHERVVRIGKALTDRGMNIWLDVERLDAGTIMDEMSKGIDDSEIVVVFITQAYIEKVMGTNANDNCKREFNYAVQRKTPSRMLAVVMEQSCLSQNWKGAVGIALGGTLHVDFSTDDNFASKIDEIEERVYKRVGSRSERRLLREPPIVLSEGFFAPEMATEAAHLGDKVDMWSCGCVLLRLLTTQKNYHSVWMTAYNHKYLDDKAEFKRQVQLRCDHLLDHLKSAESRDEDLESMLASLLSVDPSARKTAEEILQSPWFSVVPGAPSPKAMPSPLADVGKKFFGNADEASQLVAREGLVQVSANGGPFEGVLMPSPAINPGMVIKSFSGHRAEAVADSENPYPMKSKGALEKMGRRSFDTSVGIGLEPTSGGK